MNPANVAILIIDRHARYSPSIERVLAGAGYRIRKASSAKSARAMTAEVHFNIIVKTFDSGLPDGLPLMSELRELSPDTQFLFVSAGGSIRTAMDAIHKGAFDYLSWPAENEQILRSVRQALDHQALVANDPAIRQRLKKRKDVDIFVGKSGAIRDVQRLIEQVAPSDVTVLIQGESGTGKEMVARAIHEKSRRKEGPFVPVNCAALPETLIESELFGHVRGAFTGAIADKPGRFELARGGTLFLDEIGDLSRLGQADLLRVLEDGVFRPIGSRSAVRANARIVAATNKELENQCFLGAFREDLLYRLNVITIHLPPLRDRPEDIPPLADMFRRHFVARHGRRGREFGKSALRRLQSFNWPGNVRQLRNIVERLVLTAPGTRIEAADLPTSSRFPIRAENPTPRLAGMTLAETERELIRQTLEKTGGSKTRAAECLGISRRALHYKLRDLPAPKKKPARGL
ncbi:MAG: sigma-54 dependent transcriptional regulator [Terrimicrobiaceae bacterium]|nr:sigma-54 dependent transcriptional regulator [Terrimicrobiaceae bacterium]